MGEAQRRHYRKYREKEIARSIKWNQEHPESRLNTHLRRTFGINLEEFNAIFEKQNGLCAVCQKPETAIDKRTGIVRRLHVDHNHQTDQVRGLLCTRCNLALGYLLEDVEIAKSMVQYIEAGIPVKVISHE